MADEDTDSERTRIPGSGSGVRARVIVADPPWRFDDKLPGKTRGAERQYVTMSAEEICACLPAFGVEPTDDAVLFLWRVSSMQEEAFRVVRSWGFTLKSEIVWEKVTKHGKPHFGMGRFVRASHETCLIAERGRCKPAIRTQRSRFSAPVPVNERGRIIHSAKPEEFFAIVRAMYPEGPRVELFARPCHEGFDCFGKEISP